MKVILINGESRSGKSTIANLIRQKLKCKNVVLKNNSEQVKTVCKEVFGWNPQKDGKSERVRRLFREVTHTGYNFNKYFWEKISYQKVEPFEKLIDYLIVPDWRYKCTYDFWKELGYEIFTIKVERPYFDNGYDEEVKKDDIGQLKDRYFDLYIFNTETLEELEEKVEEGIRIMGW